MLKNEIAEHINLVEEKEKIAALLPGELKKYITPDSNFTSIEYPVLKYPQKINSIGFDKIPNVQGTLNGIKGQYLILDDDRVLNIRKHSGYFLQFEF